MSGAVHPSSGNSVFYTLYCACLPAKWKIISFISVKFLRTTSRSPMQISQGWQMIQHVFQKLVIIHIGGSEADNKRNSVTICYNMMFASWAISIYGVGSCEFAPFLPEQQSCQYRLCSSRSFSYHANFARWHGEGSPEHQLPANSEACASRSSHCRSLSPAAGPLTVSPS